MTSGRRLVTGGRRLVTGGRRLITVGRRLVTGGRRLEEFCHVQKMLLVGRRGDEDVVDVDKGVGNKFDSDGADGIRLCCVWHGGQGEGVFEQRRELAQGDDKLHK